MNNFLFPFQGILFMLTEFLAALVSLDLPWFIAFTATHFILLFGLLVLAALLWEGKQSLKLVVFSGIAAAALIDIVKLFSLSFNVFHFFIAFLFVAIVFEAEKPKNFLLTLFSLALFFALL